MEHYPWCFRYGKRLKPNYIPTCSVPKSLFKAKNLTRFSLKIKKNKISSSPSWIMMQYISVSNVHNMAPEWACIEMHARICTIEIYYCPPNLSKSISQLFCQVVMGKTQWPNSPKRKKEEERSPSKIEACIHTSDVKSIHWPRILTDRISVFLHTRYTWSNVKRT